MSTTFDKFISKMFSLGITFVLFTLLADSGGALGIRTIGFAVMILLSAISIFKLIKTYFAYKPFYKLTFCLMLMMMSFLPGSLVSLLNGITLTEIVKWYLALYLIIPILLIFYLIDINKIVNATIVGGVLYALFQLVIFAMMLYPSTLSSLVLSYLSNNAVGWIKFKNVFGIAFPHVYLQSTLSLVPIAIIAYCEKHYKSFVFITTYLLLSQSRFGVLSIVIFVMLSKIVAPRHYNKLLFVNIFSAYFFVLLLLIMSIYDFSHIFAYDETNGLQVRFGYLISIIQSLDINSLMFGHGPGSLFLYEGTQEMVDNMEISQLEFLRKYGIVGVSLYFMPMFIILSMRSNYKNRSILFAICAYIFVALSNPVLTSVTFTWLFAISIKSTAKIYTEKTCYA